MARPCLPIALLVSVALLAGCSSPQGSEDDGSGHDGADAGDGGASANGGPSGSIFDLEVGDRWAYRMTGSGYDSSTTSRVTAIEDRHGARSYRIEGEVTTTAEGTESTGESTTWTRVSDGATVEVQVVTHLAYAGSSFDATSTTVFDPPCGNLQWPLTVGKTWATTCQATTTTSGGQPQTSTSTTTFAVEASERVTVAAGSFDAFRIRVSADGTASTQWVSATVCGGAVKTMTNAQGTTVTMELQSYAC